MISSFNITNHNRDKRYGCVFEGIVKAESKCELANAIPTPSERGSFCLLPFGPGPVHFSLDQPGNRRTPPSMPCWRSACCGHSVNARPNDTVLPDARRSTQPAFRCRITGARHNARPMQSCYTMIISVVFLFYDRKMKKNSKIINEINKMTIILDKLVFN